MYLIRNLFVLLFVVQIASASHVSRGEKIYNLFCRKEKLRTISAEHLNADTVLRYCRDIDVQDAGDVKAYLERQSATDKAIPSITPLPKEARCPVCGMAISLYPKWSSMMTVADKKFYFDGVKDMMKYYLDRATFHYDRSRISHIVVREFYHLKEVDARKAWYVIGSDIKGPMGNELIPFQSEKEAKTFMQDHHGNKIIRFEDISPALIKSLERR